jgi:PAS domain-containing protein
VLFRSCDERGTIVEMNERAARMFREQGGAALVGTSVLDCHPEPARTKLAVLLREQRGNVYTIEKNGRRKIIHQEPWYEGGVFAGLVEIAFDLPAEVPHFRRGA